MRWKRVATAPLRGLKALTQMTFGANRGWRWWRLRRSGLDLSKVGDGSSSSIIMAALNWIGRTFPEAPPALWEFDEAGEEEVVPDHPLVRLLVRPNPYYTGSTLWMATLTDWNLSGDAYWILVRNRVGEVGEIWWAPSTLLEPRGDEHTFITHYDYNPGGGSGGVIRLDPEDVIHFRYGLDGEDPRHGRSPLSSVLKEVFTDEEAAEFTAALLKNSGVPGVVISPDSDESPDSEDVKAVKQYVSDEFTGPGRGEPLVMSGKTKVQQFGFSPEQLNLRDLRKIPEERVTAVIGLPAIVAGLGAGLDRSTFSNYSEAREAAYEDNIIPSQNMLSEDIRFQLLPFFEEDPWAFRFGFDRSKVRVLQEDETKKVERINIAIAGGWATVADGKRVLNLETLPADDIYLRPLNLIEVPLGESMLPEEPAEEEPILTPEELLARTEAAAGQEPDGQATRKAQKADRRQTRLIVALSRDYLALTSAFTSDLEKAFDEMGKDASALYQEGSRQEQLAGRTNGDVKAADDGLVEIILSQLGKKGEEKMTQLYEKHYQRTIEKTGETIESIFALGVDIPDHVARAVIHRGGTRRGLVDLTSQHRTSLRRAIAAGRENGDGPLEIARRIRSEVPSGPFPNAGPAYRSELIARTETKFAQNVSSLAHYKAAQHITSVTIFDGRLANSDEDCQARDGLVVSFEDAEAMLAEEHPNGSMSFAPNVGDTVPEPEGVPT